MRRPKIFPPEHIAALRASQQRRQARVRKALDLLDQVERTGFAVGTESDVVSDIDRVRQLAVEYDRYKDSTRRIANEVGLSLRTVRRYRKLAGVQLTTEAK